MSLIFEKARANPSPMEDSADQVFEALFEEHWERVYNVIFRLVGETAEAEDLALEVFWRLYSQAPRTGDQASLRGWLYRVATNLGYNALRSRRRRTHYELQASRLADQMKQTTDPALDVERAEEKKRVRQVLVKMKPRAAKILILRYSGLTYQEIAQAIKVSPGSVGTLLARAENAFARIYQKMEGV